MRELYGKLLAEKKKLDALVARARRDGRSAAANEAILAQSRTVDALLEKLYRQTGPSAGRESEDSR